MFDFYPLFILGDLRSSGLTDHL